MHYLLTDQNLIDHVLSLIQNVSVRIAEIKGVC